MKSADTKIIIVLLILSILSAPSIVLITLSILEINNNNAMTQYKDDYQAALKLHAGTESGIDLGIGAFKQAYANLADSATADRIRQLYAADLYFNDTVTTIRTRDELTEYMRKTSEKVKTSKVEVDQVLRDGVDVFVRWTMHFESSAYGIKVDSDTIGLSHLRFNADGQVVLHQDFWDSTAGIYSHLPIVGFFVRRAQAALE